MTVSGSDPASPLVLPMSSLAAASDRSTALRRAASSDVDGRDPAPAERTATARPAAPLPYNRRLYAELARWTDGLVMLSVLGAVFVVVNVGLVPAAMDSFLLPRFSFRNVLLLVGLTFAWQTLFGLFELYDVREPVRLRDEVPRVAAAGTLGVLASLVLVASSRTGAFSVRVVLVAWPLVIGATLAARYALRKLCDRARRRPRRDVLIVGSGPIARRLLEQLRDDPTAGHHVLGCVDVPPVARTPELRRYMLGPIAGLETFLMGTVVDEVVIALPVKSCYAEIQQAIEVCERAGVQSRYGADLFPVRLARPRVAGTPSQPGVAMTVVRDDYRLALKRAIDVTGAAAGLAALSPLLLAIGLAVKLTSPGPALFTQERFGWRKRRFRMLKFRTMVADAEAMQESLESHNEAGGPVFKIQNDPRVTRVGRVLRRTSLDELPQLWNVLRGDMSLVGPRPLPIRDVTRFSDPGSMRRFSVRPGCTGLWQVSGRSALGFDAWMTLDLQYIDAWSLALDARILLRTIPAVLRMRGAA